MSDEVVSEKANEPEGCSYALASFFLIVPMWCAWSFVMLKHWQWFGPTFGLPDATFHHMLAAIGLTFPIRAYLYRSSKSERDWIKLLATVLLPWFVLSFGWFTHMIFF